MADRDILDIYPLAPTQEGMLFHTLYAPESGTYVEQASGTLRGELDGTAFEEAWQRLMDRHSVLRTAFVWQEVEEPVQVVFRRLPAPLTRYDWRDLTPEQRSAQLEALRNEDRAQGFDMGEAPLMRLHLVRTGEDTHELIWTIHHVLVDGWSLPILFQEVFVLYEALASGRPPMLPPTRPYRDYIAWLRRQNQEEAERYWRQTLAGFRAPTPLVVDHPPDPGAAERYAEQDLVLSPELSGDLAVLARQTGITPSTLMQAAWALLLGRYSGQDDVVFGASVSGRPTDLPGAEAMVGLFISTLPVRTRIEPGLTVRAWLRQLQEYQVEMLHQKAHNLVQIHGWSEVPRDQPLFESILVYENYPSDAALEEQLAGAREPGAAVSIENVRSREQTNYPLTLVAGLRDVLMLRISYDCRRFEAETIVRMLGHLETLLAGMVATPDGLVGDLPMITGEERRQLLETWNATSRAFPGAQVQGIHELVQAQVDRAPHRIAAEFTGADGQVQRLTYRELDQRANQLAHLLRRLGVSPETLVGLQVERSLEMLVGLLGILKAGGAYLPLDPTYPRERLHFMIQDSGVRILLTQETLQSRTAVAFERVPAGAGPVAAQPYAICLDADRPLIERQPADRPPNLAAADNLAYVIYTSGSTGTPKGVAVTHGSLSNHARAMVAEMELAPEDRMLQFISPSFDAAGEELYPTLISGATLVIPRSTDGLLGSGLFRYCAVHGVTVLHMPASAWHAAMDDLAAEGKAISAPLRLLTLGGDAPSVARLRAFSDLLGRPISFINLYGPTETTITATLFHASTAADGLERMPIGRPVANTRAYVLDRQAQLVPVGVPGELYIGGAGVARGYLARPGATAAGFVPDLFAETARLSSRLYRTGDLARWLPDGNLEFLGRADDQVKVRGFRVELGEIETLLGQHEGVQSAAVMALAEEGMDKQLVAYWVPRGEPATGVSELRSYLGQRLPSYMVPAAFVQLDALPLSPTGKIDRNALPAPDGRSGEGQNAFVTPRTAEEEILAGILAQLLRIERAGATDSFFDLGGHSLLATRLASRIREVFGVDLHLRTIFDHPTVAELAALVSGEMGRRGEQDGASPAAEGDQMEGQPLISRPAGQAIPLSFAQQRLWFLDQLEPGNLFYNIPTAVRLIGRLDVEALWRAMNEIVKRHEVLRTTFDAAGGTPVQVIAPEQSVELPVVDLRRHLDPEEEALSQATRAARIPFDLAKGPLLRAALYQLAEDEAILLVVIHHIVADGWSLGVLVQELAALYEAFAAGQPSPLPDLPVQYADYATWQRQWLAQGEEESAGSALHAQLAYWQEQLADIPPLLELPTDRPRPAVQSANGATYAFSLPLELSSAIKALGRREGTTLYMTLLAAYQALLARYAGQDDICVGSVVANRGHTAWEPLIGFFVNTLVLRARFDGNPTFRELLAQVRSTTLDAYAHQNVPFEMLVDALQPERSLSHTPLFQAAFSLQNTPMPEATLPGLALRSVTIDRGATQFDMLLTMADTPEGLAGAWEYNTDLFDESTIRRMAGHLQALLMAMAADPDQAATTVPLLTAEERQRILVDWNDTATPFPGDRTLHGLFADQVAQQPEHPAVLFAGPGKVEMLTYGELDRRANQLAHLLRSHGAGPGTLVAIALQRSLQVPVAILAVLKAGAAFVPVDPAYPAERVRFMLEDSAASIVLVQRGGEAAAETQRALRGALDQTNPEATAQQPLAIRLDEAWEAVEESPETPVGPVVGPEGLAYCIYTSGSTGTPKGTLLRHRGLANLAQVQRRAFEITPHSRILQFAPLSFDASVWELTMALANGATLVLAPQDTLASGPELLQLLRDQAITTVTLPPSLLAILEPGELPELRTVIAAGERCTRDIVQRWAPGRRFFNAYGPTETTVCASMVLCSAEDAADPSIGGPIDNFQLYVVDGNLQPLPVGVPGELLIAGVGLAQGYLNRPELTAERFRTVAIDGMPQRVYRSGDLVRWRPDGTLDFLGRIDHQVKLRGFRIELGEVETALRSHPVVVDAVAVAREDTLVVYFIPEDGQEPPAADLRTFLRHSLPEHMIPAAFVPMDAFPLTPAGKVDRSVLPAPAAARQDSAAYVPPSTETEARLAEMAASLLKLDRIGIHDNFFELGGHSLLATQLISRIRDELAVDVPLRTLFEHPTVAGLATVVDETQARQQAEGAAAPTPAPAITPRPRGGRRMTLSQLEAEEKAGEGNVGAGGGAV